MSLKRTKISHVRLAAFSGIAAALLAVPLGAVLTSSEPLDGPPAPDGVVAQSEPVQARVGPREQPHREVSLLGAESQGPTAKRERVRGLASLSTERLAGVAQGGGQVERLAAVNLLWVRGERQQVEELAAGDRVLTAKVAALRKAGR